MNFDVKKEEKLENNGANNNWANGNGEKEKTLEYIIICEYLWLIFIKFFVPFFMKTVIGLGVGVPSNFNGVTYIFVLILTILYLASNILVSLLNPIRILVQYKKKFKEIEPLGKKIIYIFLAALPLIISALGVIMGLMK